MAAAVMFGSLGRAASQSPVTLPVEVVGPDGTTATVTVDVPPPRARDVRSLWMQIHGLSYPDMVGVSINNTAWFALNNETVAVAEPGASYGGIGGGYSTLSVTLALPADAVVGGPNTIRFRFIRSDGIASGFRVVAFNLLTADSRRILEAGAFVQEDPAAWTPPLSDSSAALTGRELWTTAPLSANALPNAPRIRAHCADCHAVDGRDLKYFAFSNASIIARSRFHGLTDLQGRQIASYIRSHPVAAAGRPWNPPYQPGPGLDAQPVSSWAAGAGLSWVLDSDAAALPYIFGSESETASILGSDAGRRVSPSSAIVPRISRNAFRPDGNLNPREIPIALQLPDWNRWLPRVHPLDAWGAAFETSEFAELYGSSSSAGARSAKAKPSLRATLASPELSAQIASGRIVAAFDKWTSARRTLLKPFVEPKNVKWSSDLAVKAYSTQLWQLVKTWEMTQEFGLEARGRELFGPAGESRTWFNTVPASTAPAAANIPDGPSGMGGSALTNEYFDACWYQLQILLNSGNHRHRDRLPVDWLYVVGRFQDLYAESRRPEPARLLVALIKAMQSTDPRLGPEDSAQGWRPNQNVDPRIMIDAAWAPMFEPLGGDVRRAVTESLLGAWLDKNLQYPIGRYFHVGLSESSYAAPSSYGNIAGGKIWQSASSFAAAGVDPALVQQLQRWGRSYEDAAARFQYAPGGSAPRKSVPPTKKSGPGPVG